MTCAPTDHLRLCSVNITEAKRFVARFHRHHRPPQGALASVGVALNGEIVGVAILGRPVARHNDDGQTVEITRVATDGTRNACSFLYGAAHRLAAALGYSKCITYTLAEESGASLRGADWRCVGLRGGGSWSVPSRRRVDKHPLGQKVLWEKVI